MLETFFINELRPSLNVQSDSLCAKVFKYRLFFRFYCCSFSVCFTSLFYIFKNFCFYIVLNIFLLIHVYIVILLTFYLLENDRRSVETLPCEQRLHSENVASARRVSKRRFLSVIFTVFNIYFCEQIFYRKQTLVAPNKENKSYILYKKRHKALHCFINGPSASPLVRALH